MNNSQLACLLRNHLLAREIRSQTTNLLIKYIKAFRVITRSIANRNSTNFKQEKGRVEYTTRSGEMGKREKLNLKGYDDL